jgi:GDPmannose 4,6-dehydratase
MARRPACSRHEFGAVDRDNQDPAVGVSAISAVRGGRVTALGAQAAHGTFLSMLQKTALITGITGQDGSYLAEFLLARGYAVHGIVRRASTFNTERIDHVYDAPSVAPDSMLRLHYADLGDSSSLQRVLAEVRPDEVYNLGAQSHVRVSFDLPEYTADVTGTGTLRLLEAMRNLGMSPRFYQASSSEQFGKVLETPQRETTPFYPRSPYAAAKVYAHWITVNYRESYGLPASCGILFNHESPRRGENFVTRKITRGLTRIKLGLQEKLALGNLDAKRDWGFAGDYVEAMWLMLQHDVPDDFVVATGETHSIREFLDEAAAHLDLDWRAHVVHDARFERPAEVDLLLGDPTKARDVLGWRPRVTFRGLVQMMCDADLALATQERSAR